MGCNNHTPNPSTDNTLTRRAALAGTAALMPSGSEIDRAIDQMADAMAATPMAVRRAAGVVAQICLRLRPAAALALVEQARDLRDNRERRRGAGA